MTFKQFRSINVFYLYYKKKITSCRVNKNENIEMNNRFFLSINCKENRIWREIV